MTIKRTITIRFSVDKNGKRRAHYWGSANRWLPISADEAELKLATDPRYVRNTRDAPLTAHCDEPALSRAGEVPADEAAWSRYYQGI